MKQFFLLIAILFSGATLFAQNGGSNSGFEFSVVKENQVTPVKNQSSSGTCWCFSGIALIESELLRTGKGTQDLSEMYLVHKNYEEKAKKYVRMHGETGFSGGGSFADVIEGIRDYGIVPDTIMTGLNYGENKHLHGELDELTKSYVTTLIKNPNKKLSTAWFEGFNGILDAYLGKCPSTFTYNGKNYTPQSYAKMLGITPENYVSITSFSHHPFYEQFPIEVQDNWRWAMSYNLPLEEMIAVVRNAVENGFCVAWASDVSEKGFSRKGIAVVPDIEAKETAGSDQERWIGLSKREREDIAANLSEPMPELDITQEMRQKAFDNYETTDDHGMLIYGIAKDQKGNTYFLVKNSWGDSSPYKGTWYASEAFVKYKTTNIVVHKDALSKDVKKKLNLR